MVAEVGEPLLVVAAVVRRAVVDSVVAYLLSPSHLVGATGLEPARVGLSVQQTQ